jgi:hypothetical protein
MATLELEGPYLSVSRILRSADPKGEVIHELIGVLRARLKVLGIRWNPRAFRAGLHNLDLPEGLLDKLEGFLRVAESVNWALPKPVAEELDRVIEDIESFNPAFGDRLRTSRASGRVSALVVKKRLGL